MRLAGEQQVQILGVSHVSKQSDVYERIRGAGSRLVILLYVPEPSEGHVHVSTDGVTLYLYSIVPRPDQFCGREVLV